MKWVYFALSLLLSSCTHLQKEEGSNHFNRNVVVNDAVTLIEQLYSYKKMTFTIVPKDKFSEVFIQQLRKKGFRVIESKNPSTWFSKRNEGQGFYVEYLFFKLSHDDYLLTLKINNVKLSRIYQFKDNHFIARGFWTREGRK